MVPELNLELKTIRRPASLSPVARVENKQKLNAKIENNSYLREISFALGAGTGIANVLNLFLWHAAILGLWLSLLVFIGFGVSLICHNRKIQLENRLMAFTITQQGQIVKPFENWDDIFESTYGHAFSPKNRW